MRRQQTATSRRQRLFWVMSILVVASMAIGLMVSFTPRTPRGTGTPTPTVQVALPLTRSPVP